MPNRAFRQPERPIAPFLQRRSAALIGSLLIAAFSSMIWLPYSWTTWLPEYCRIHNCYCEPFRNGYFVLQPASTLSNLGFIVAGLAVMTFRQASVWIQPKTFGAVLIMVGLCSFFSHASLSLAGEWFDLMGVYLLLTTLTVVNLQRALEIPALLAIGLGGLVLMFGGVQMAFAPQYQQFVIILLVAAVAGLEALTWLRKRATGNALILLLAAALYMGGALIRMIAGRGCMATGNGLPWHAVWHLLAAASGLVMYKYYAGSSRFAIG